MLDIKLKFIENHEPMKRLTLLPFILFLSIGFSYAQGCFPNANFAQENFGLYPTGALNMDCGGTSSSKTVINFVDTVMNIEIIPQSPTLVTFYIGALRLDSVENLPYGLEVSTDVFNTAIPEAPYGTWLNDGAVPNQTAAIGCFSITGNNLAWLNASTGGPNNDGIYTITLTFDYRVNGTDPDITTIIPNGTWMSDVPTSIGGGLLTMDIELNINETGCVGGDLFVLPSVTADNMETQDCDGEATVEVYNGTPPYTYTFSNGVTTQTATGLCAGVYSLEVTDALGAQSVVQFAVAGSSNAYTTVEPNIPPNTDSLYTYYNECDLDYTLPLDSFSIVDAYTIGPDTCEVTWLAWQEGEPFTLVTYYPFLGPEPTVFSLILWCQNGRSEAGVFQLYEFLDLTIVGIEEDIKSLDFEVHPNPASGLFNVQFAETKPLSIEVFNTKGGIVKSIVSMQNEKQTIDLTNSPNGIYFLKIQSEDGFGVKQIIKQ